jgi:hypothetical protein
VDWVDWTYHVGLLQMKYIISSRFQITSKGDAKIQKQNVIFVHICTYLKTYQATGSV